MKSAEFWRALSEKSEPDIRCYRMYCSLGDSLLADKPVKQILLGSGKVKYSPSRIWMEAILRICQKKVLSHKILLNTHCKHNILSCCVRPN